MRKPLIVIVGETASGKSALAIELAGRFNGEIICADSRTVYKGLNIGTAKPTADERANVPHHLLDIVTPDQPFTAADFKRLANEAIDDITMRGKIPIMVGGTGLYIDSVLFNYSFAPAGAERDPKNPRHLSKSAQNSREGLRSNTLVIGLSLEREKLRERVSNRVNDMVQAGLVHELRGLAEKYGWDAPALQAPGYKAFRGYLKGEKTLDEAKALFISSDMNLAKRQRTWFKRNNSIHWANNREQAIELVTTFLSNNQVYP